MTLNQRIEAALGSPVAESQSLSGGHTAESQRVALADGRLIFVKQGGGSFASEAKGLRALAAPSVIRLPKILHAEEDLLILEHIASGPAPSDFMPRFGRQFAALHQTEGDRFGFDEDNWIGGNRQQNLPGSDDWCDFYWTHRLEPQFCMAMDRGFGELAAGMAALESRLPVLLAGSEETPRLLHGDLWGGNFLCDAAGDAVLIDPAVYFGHREADLAMTRLFGGFSEASYAAYEEALPLPAGAADRLPLYQLYHVLNHLNLFGSGYLGQVKSILRLFGLR